MLHDILVAYARCISNAEKAMDKYRIIARKENRKLTKEEEKTVKELEEKIYKSYKVLENYYHEESIINKKVD
ncbi:MAG: hypothetical protein KH135_00135 [Firmicutes bacterium]|nr:hypothetical protein [Bacillota bacterium]